jgi:catechol 2,3-dioxygenase-like lactoylglutathione lyase family enzyme
MIVNHVSVGVKDVEEAGRFYDAVLGALGYSRYGDFLPEAIAYGDDSYEFWVQLPSNQKPGDAGNGVHIAFNAPDIESVGAFHRAALAHGGRDEGEPGPRPDYGSDYYGCFVRDPDGNKIEAVLKPKPHIAKAKAPKPARKTETVKDAKNSPKKS